MVFFPTYTVMKERSKNRIDFRTLQRTTCTSSLVIFSYSPSFCCTSVGVFSPSREKSHFVSSRGPNSSLEPTCASLLGLMWSESRMAEAAASSSCFWAKDEWMWYQMKGNAESNGISLWGKLHPKEFYLSPSYEWNSFVLHFLTDWNVSKH